MTPCKSSRASALVEKGRASPSLPWLPARPSKVDHRACCASARIDRRLGAARGQEYRPRSYPCQHALCPRKSWPTECPLDWALKAFYLLNCKNGEIPLRRFKVSSAPLAFATISLVSAAFAQASPCCLLRRPPTRRYGDSPFDRPQCASHPAPIPRPKAKQRMDRKASLRKSSNPEEGRSEASGAPPRRKATMASEGQRHSRFPRQRLVARVGSKPMTRTVAHLSDDYGRAKNRRGSSRAGRLLHPQKSCLRQSLSRRWYPGR